MGLEYPKELPLEEVAFLWDRVRGKQVPLGKLLHAAWAVLGYALYQMAPVGTAPPLESVHTIGPGSVQAIGSGSVQAIGDANLDFREVEAVLEGLVKGTTQAGPATWWMLFRLAIWVIGEGK